MSQASNEGEDRSPVNFAKFRQCRVDLLRVAVRIDARKNNAPASRVETTVGGPTSSWFILAHEPLIILFA